MLLEERRASLTAQRVRSVNQLHALLRDLVVGGAPTALEAAGAAALLRKIRPTTTTQRTRRQLAWDLVREIRAMDTALESITERYRHSPRLISPTAGVACTTWPSKVRGTRSKDTVSAPQRRGLTYSSSTVPRGHRSNRLEDPSPSISSTRCTVSRGYATTSQSTTLSCVALSTACPRLIGTAH